MFRDSKTAKRSKKIGDFNHLIGHFWRGVPKMVVLVDGPISIAPESDDDGAEWLGYLPAEQVSGSAGHSPTE